MYKTLCQGLRTTVFSTICFMVADTSLAETVLPVYECRKTSEPIVVDGVLNERTWEAAESIQLGLWDTAGTPVRQTLVQLAWNKQQLFLAWRVIDEDLLCTMSERDGDIHKEEVIELFVDPGDDQTDYLEFEWNSLGACLDLLLVNVSEHHRHSYFKWDARGMQWAVQREQLHTGETAVPGWTCEVAVPLDVFEEAGRLPIQDGETWRINLYRIERSGGQEEYSAWSAVPGGHVSFHRPERFGRLIFRDEALF